MVGAPAPISRQILALFDAHRARLATVVVLVAVAACCGILPPFVVQMMFDEALFPAGRPVDITLAAQLAGALVLLAVALAALGAGQAYQVTRLVNTVVSDLRVRVFAHLHAMDLSFFTAVRGGQIQSRLVNDVTAVQNVLNQMVAMILGNCVAVTAAVVAMVVMDWRLTIVTLLLLPPLVLLQLRVGRYRQRLAVGIQESLAEMMQSAHQALSVSGVLLSKLFDRHTEEVDRYRAENDRHVRLQVRQYMAAHAFESGVSSVLSVAPAATYLACGLFLLSGGTTTIGTVVAFTTLQLRLLQPTASLLQMSLNVQTSVVLFRRVFEYVALEPAVAEPPVAAAAVVPGCRGSISLRRVWFAYPSMHDGGGPAPQPVRRGEAGRWALRDVSLDVEPGQFVAVVGPSGAGKTTLSYLIPRIFDATRGHVLVDGIDVRHLGRARISRSVGVVTQDPFLLHASVAANLRYARSDATPREIEEAARAANIHDQIMRWDDGYETVVGERGYRLSGGEKQRLAIARVLLRDPAILVLDEATSALDSTNERLVREAIERATALRTTIAIAHRLSTIVRADMILVLDEGVVVEAGSHVELLRRGGQYAGLCAEQFGAGLVAPADTALGAHD